MRYAFEIKGLTIPVGQECLKIGGLVTSVVLDIKERDAVLMMNGGYYRCNCCDQHGKSFGSGCPKFPFTQKKSLRTNDTFRLDALLAEDTSGRPMRGIKAKSPILKLYAFDPTQMVPMEVMHTFDLGVVLYLLQAWVGKSRKTKHFIQNQGVQAWSLSQEEKDELQKRIEEVQLPHGFTRKLHLNRFDKWKADGTNLIILN